MSGDWQEVTPSARDQEKWMPVFRQAETASITKGAAVAATSKAAMIKNQWGGNVARRAFMAANVC